MATIDLNGIRLRNRLLTSASLLGYGACKSRLILYGLSPIAQWVPLERFGAVTTRTVSLQPREGHFTLKEDWGLREFPEMLRLYGRALHKVDGGWLNAFGWSNIGIERYFDEYYGRTANLNRIVSVGGFSADEIEQLIETCNERAKPGEIAAVELNASCHNVNFPFGTILEEALRRAVPKSRHPVILKVSPDEDYHWQANLAATHGCAAITAINTVKGLRLRPDTGEPYLKNRYGAVSGRAIKPIGLRVVAELRDAGFRLPIIANGGIRDFDDCREYFWAGADAVSLGSAVWLRPMPLYALGPVEGLRIRRLIDRVARFTPPAAAPHWEPATAPPPHLRRDVSLPRVAVVTTGGTIDSVGADRLDLAAYLDNATRLAPGELLSGIAPELEAIARVHEVPFRRVRAHAITDDDLADLVATIRYQFERDEADGVVITHGTNTLEETAWLLHLVLPGNGPVVLTGAMRPATALSADGPLNLVDAVRVAASPAARDLGVLVVLDDTIHGARDATKSDTMRVSAFRDGASGPLGWVDGDGRVVINHVPSRGASLRGRFAGVDLRALQRVDVVISYQGADGVLIDAAVAAGARGIVSAGTGAGYPTPGEVEALERATAAGVTVVQAHARRRWPRAGGGVACRARLVGRVGPVAMEGPHPAAPRAGCRCHRPRRPPGPVRRGLTDAVSNGSTRHPRTDLAHPCVERGRHHQDVIACRH